MVPREGFEPPIPRSSVSPLSVNPMDLVRSYPIMGNPNNYHRATPPWLLKKI